MNKGKVKTKKESEKDNENKIKKESLNKEKKEKDLKATKKEKDIAIANGFSLRISPKHSFAICRMIRGKTPEKAIEILREVSIRRRPVPMASREVAHQKGRGVAGAKFPKKASLEIMKIVEQVKANAVVNGIENPIITISKADVAKAPFRSGGRKAKRAHIHLEVRDRTKIKLREKKK